VEELQAAVGVLLGNRDHQAQVGLDHFLLGATGAGFTDRHATVDVLDVGDGQLGIFFQRDELLLRAEYVGLDRFQFGRVARLVSQQAIDPAFVGLVAREAAQEVGTGHARVTYTQLHDGAFLGTDVVLGAANTHDQCIVLLGHQLDRHEQLGQCFQFGYAFGAVTTVLIERLADLLQLLVDSTEALTGQFRVRAAITFFGLFLFGFLVLFLVFVVSLLVVLWLGCFAGNDGIVRAGHAVIVRVDVTAEDV